MRFNTSPTESGSSAPGGSSTSIPSLRCGSAPAPRHVRITFNQPVDASAFANLEGVRVQHLDGNVLELAASAAVLDGIVKEAARYELVDLVSAPAELEEIGRLIRIAMAKG